MFSSAWATAARLASTVNIGAILLNFTSASPEIYFWINFL
ncbi:hypothetical protein BSIN_0007 [Burkholderia singularis]|uniref:Uncharacterized protein n=1 Tax=Burkholderia singularis TaxID=1503053 RepID=A0A238H1Y9_9BURK|nr:hypothetical protein BSIN_0007 [Burkholderia singularis]